MFLPNTQVKGAALLAEALRVAIESIQMAVDGERLKITASIGVAANHLEEQTMQAIQQLADQAMYEAKRGGRNRVSTFGDDATGLSLSAA